MPMTPEEKVSYANAWTVYLTAMESVANNEQVAEVCHAAMKADFTAAELSVTLMPYAKQAATGGAVDWDKAVADVKAVTGYFA